MATICRDCDEEVKEYATSELAAPLETRTRMKILGKIIGWIVTLFFIFTVLLIWISGVVILAMWIKIGLMELGVLA